MEINTYNNNDNSPNFRMRLSHKLQKRTYVVTKEIASDFYKEKGDKIINLVKQNLNGRTSLGFGDDVIGLLKICINDLKKLSNDTFRLDIRRSFSLNKDWSIMKPFQSPIKKIELLELSNSALKEKAKFSSVDPHYKYGNTQPIVTILSSDLSDCFTTARNMIFDKFVAKSVKPNRAINIKSLEEKLGKEDFEVLQNTIKTVQKEIDFVNRNFK